MNDGLVPRWLPRLATLAVMAGCSMTLLTAQTAEPEVNQLRQEVAGKGWLLYSAWTDAGDYDLFLSRPDGSAKRNVTQTPGQHEFGGRFSADGKRMLYRQMAKGAEAKPGEVINHDLWGAAGVLVIANADGSQPQPQGKEGEFPWACWSPDGKQVSCLYKREGKIRIFELGSKKLVRELPRQGIFQQMFWSADGKRLCGTANLNGQDWNILSVEIESGKATQVSRNLCCTPDWFQADPERVIYSNRIPGLSSDYGVTFLMQASADGKSRKLIYGEAGRHVYYGCTSPDDKYVVFAVPVSDGGTDAEMAVIRLADAPIVVPADFKQMRELAPEAKAGPVLRLGQPGFEPHWTYAELGGK